MAHVILSYLLNDDKILVPLYIFLVEKFEKLLLFNKNYERSSVYTTSQALLACIVGNMLVSY